MKPRHCREICGESIALAGFELLHQRIDRLLDQLLNRFIPTSAPVWLLMAVQFRARRIFPVRRGSDFRSGVVVGAGWKSDCWHGEAPARELASMSGKNCLTTKFFLIGAPASCFARWAGAQRNSQGRRRRRAAVVTQRKALTVPTASAKK